MLLCKLNVLNATIEGHNGLQNVAIYKRYPVQKQVGIKM